MPNHVVKRVQVLALDPVCSRVADTTSTKFFFPEDTDNPRRRPKDEHVLVLDGRH